MAAVAYLFRRPMGNRKIGAKVSNKNFPSVTISDYYVWDSTRGSGYYGSVEYILRAGESIYMTSDEFIKKLVVEKKPQEIRIIIDGEKIAPFFHHTDLENNQEIVLEKNGDGRPGIKFIARKGTPPPMKGSAGANLGGGGANQQPKSVDLAKTSAGALGAGP